MHEPHAFFSRRWQVLFAGVLLIFAGLARAQSGDGQGTEANDPPTRVARLSFAGGDLGLLPAGSTAWTAADVNRPLTNGDKLSGGPGARAELDLGGAALRINGQSDIGILNLNGQTGQFELTQGTLNLTVRNIDQGSTYEIDTPTLALVINQPGSFRVDVAADGNSTVVSVNDGLAMVYGQNQAQRDVYSGRRYQFNDSSLNDVTVSDITGSDAFDLWCSNLDTQEASQASAQYVSDDVVGGDDLNGWGNWEEDEDYGPVWYPVNVVAGWAPYRFGHWVWIAPWGWTWVDSLPWGFAPYHYGRWAFLHNHWGWIPGPRHARPIYAPALVAFVGAGAGRPVGWFPLGPRDVYSPWYRASHNYYTSVNLANLGAGHDGDQTGLIDRIHNQYGLYQSGRTAAGTSYAYRNTPAALTAVSAQAFANAHDVRGNQVRLDPQQLATAAMMAPTALQRPGGGSFGQPRLIDGRSLPSAGFNRQVVAIGHPATAITTTASTRAGLPTSNVRVLDIRPRPQAISRVQASGGAEATQTSRFTAPTQISPPAAEQPPSRPATLPQIPHFESAQQIKPVEQVPRYQPATRSFAPREENPEQARYEAVQRSHSYVPEQRAQQVNPSYQPYARPDTPRPELQTRFQPETHPQSSPHPHASAPTPAHGEGNQH